MKKIITLLLLAINLAAFSQANQYKAATSTNATAPISYTARGIDSLHALQAAQIKFLLDGKAKDSVRLLNLEKAGFVVESRYWAVNKTGDTMLFKKDTLVKDILAQVNIPTTDLKPVYDSIAKVADILPSKVDITVIAGLNDKDVAFLAKLVALRDFFNGLITIKELEAKLQ